MAFVEFILKILKDERRRRQTTTGGITVIFVDPTPRVIDGVLEVAFFVQDEQGMIVSGSDIAQTVRENEDDLVATVSGII